MISYILKKQQKQQNKSDMQLHFQFSGSLATALCVQTVYEGCACLCVACVSTYTLVCACVHVCGRQSVGVWTEGVSRGRVFCARISRCPE